MFREVCDGPEKKYIDTILLYTIIDFMKTKFCIVFLLLINQYLFSQINNIYNNGNGTILETLTTGNRTWILRKHEGTYRTDRQFNVYENFLQEGSHKIVFSVKPEETISTLAVISDGAEEDSDTWIKVIDNENNSGWIHMDANNFLNNPYRDNDWMILDIIHIGGKTLTVRKLSTGGLVDVTLNIRDAPGLHGNILGQIDGRGWGNTISVSGSAIIEEADTIDGITDHWVKYNGHYENKGNNSIEDITGGKGWVFAGYFFPGKGGPKYYTPEIRIKYFFYWYV